MKPADYQGYSGSIDFLSSPQLSPEIGYFIELISRSLRRDALIADIGGGTGYILERILDRRLDLKASLIEPAKSMYQQAESRFTTGRARLFNAPIESVISKLESQDAFILCRSLYALGNYHSLFDKLAEKLAPYGQLFILEPNTGLYDIAAYRLVLEQRLSPPEHQEFQHHWPVIELALQRFNAGVKNGEFTLFQPEELSKIADNKGFDQIFYRSPGIYTFRKRMDMGDKHATRHRL